MVEILDEERGHLTPSEGDIGREELRQAAGLARHGAWRLEQRLLGRSPAEHAEALRHDLSLLIAEQARVWRTRSRPGGLQDSLARLQHALPKD